MRVTPSSAPRYVAQFRNGVWQVFDRIYYGVVGSELIQRLAVARASNLNARKAGK